MAVKTNYSKNGSSYYRVTATIGKDENGKLIRKEFYGKSKKEAEEKRDEYLINVRSGLAVDYQEHALGNLMKLWLFEVIKPNKAENTLVRYMGIYNYIKSSNLYSIRIYNLTPMDIQKYYNELATGGKTHSQILMINKVLKSFFNYCIKQRYIFFNPCAGVELPKKDTTSDSEKVDPFTDEEIKTILDGATDYMIPIITIALATGLREGELLALTIQDIDLSNNTIHVNKSLKATYDIKSETERTKVIKVGSTKTKSSVRDVPIPKNIAPLLKEQVNNQKMLFMRYGMLQQTQFLFTTPIGKCIDPKNLQRRWVRLLNRMNVRYRKFHNIRHTYATKLFEAGINIKTIQTLLGHSSITITEKTYVHVLQNIKADAVDKINYLF